MFLRFTRPFDWIITKLAFAEAVGTLKPVSLETALNSVRPRISDIDLRISDIDLRISDLRTRELITFSYRIDPRPRIGYARLVICGLHLIMTGL